jgi:hypothetical protein
MYRAVLSYLLGLPCLEATHDAKRHLPSSTTTVPNGRTECPCRGLGIGHILAASPGFWSSWAPPTYGSACAGHDEHMPSTCAFANGTSRPGAPSWCRGAWCWVDPATCALPAFSSTYWDFAGIFFSYEACWDRNESSTSTALSDLRGGTSPWIPGGRQVRAEQF